MFIRFYKKDSQGRPKPTCESFLCVQISNVFGREPNELRECLLLGL